MSRSAAAVGIAALAAALGAPAAGREKVPPRLNVLFIAADDLKPLLGCYGAPVVKSPCIDRLAARGLVFTRAYCQQAVCAPSRNSLLTGLRPDTIGIYDLATFFRTKVPDAVTLPQLFRKNGYRTQSIGKIYHTGHGNRDDALSWSEPSIRPGGQYALPESTEARRKRMKEAKERGQDASRLQGPATECADVPDDAYADGKIAAEAVRRLGEMKDGPFFLAVGFLKPHLPFCAPKKYWDLYDRASFRAPDVQKLPEGAPAFAGHNSGELRKYCDIPPVEPLTAAQASELIHGYHAAVSYVDAQVGRLLDALDRLGLAGRTAVVLWGDHGWHLGDHGLWCKHTNFEQAARVPLILSVPGQRRPGSRTGALAEFVDIYPTLAGLCGLKPPETIEGTSLAPLLEDPDRPWKRAAFHLYPRGIRGQGSGMGRAVRTARHRLVEWTVRGKDFRALELYDYQSDPDETVNLAAKPGHEKTVKELLDLLHGGWKAARPPGP